MNEQKIKYPATKDIPFKTFAEAHASTGCNWAKTAKLLGLSRVGCYLKFKDTFKIKVVKKNATNKEFQTSGVRNDATPDLVEYAAGVTGSHRETDHD